MSRRKTKFKKIFVLDTNIILNDVENIYTLSQNGENLIVLPETVLDELDNKKSGFEEINYQAREFGRIYNEATLLQVDRTNKKLITISSKSFRNGEVAYINVISKKKYDSDNDSTIPVNIRNDRKIIEIARDVQTEFSNVFFISLDIMAKNRALSIGVDVQTINTNEDKKVILSADLELEHPEDEYSIFDIFTMDVPETVQHLKITDKDGKPFFYYRTGNLFRLIDEKALCRQEISPQNMGQKVLMSQMLDDYYDIVVSNSPAGCVLPGTTVEIKQESIYMNANELQEKFGIDNIKQRKLRKNKNVKFTKPNNKKFIYDITTITPNIIKSLDFDSGTKLMYNSDKKFNSKYLKLDYWMNIYDIELAKKCVRYTRGYKEFFDIDSKYLIDIKYNPKTLDKTCFKIVFRMINNIKKGIFLNLGEMEGFSNSVRVNDFWTFRGYTFEEANLKVSKYQTTASNIRKEKASILDYREASVRCIEYYLKRGYTFEEGSKKIEDIQNTFSLQKCIHKYGLEEGTKVFNKRQETLNSKPQEEIDRINKLKGTQHNSDIPNVGSYSFYTFETNPELIQQKAYMYYISFEFENKKIYKVGITKNITERLSVFKLLKNFKKIKVIEDILPVIFAREQYLLQKYERFRTRIKDISTELFTEDILKLEDTK